MGVVLGVVRHRPGHLVPGPDAHWTVTGRQIDNNLLSRSLHFGENEAEELRINRQLVNLSVPSRHSMSASNYALIFSIVITKGFLFFRNCIIHRPDIDSSRSWPLKNVQEQFFGTCFVLDI